MSNSNWRCAITDPPGVGVTVLLWHSTWECPVAGFLENVDEGGAGNIYLAPFYDEEKNGWDDFHCGPTHWLPMPVHPA